MSRVKRKPVFCTCKIKGADQLHADQRLCICYIESTSSTYYIQTYLKGPLKNR